MMTCPACAAPPGAGLTHTCAQSGTWLAAEAHVDGAVLEPITVPIFDVTIQFGIIAATTEQVREKLTEMVKDVLDDDDIIEATFSIVSRTPEAVAA